jgi:nicotinamide-nucleotide amidase
VKTKAEIITIGDELLYGHTIDTNAAFISERVTAAGAQVVWRTTVGDDLETITEAIARALQRADIIIATGGLGPTNDDITKRAICKYFKRPLIFYDKILKKIEDRFKQRGLTMPAINQNQALLPQAAEFIDNPVGSALGIAIEEDEKLFVATPGVPSEMEPMIEGWVTDAIKKRSGEIVTIHRKIRTVGIIESVLYEKIADLIDPRIQAGRTERSAGDEKIAVAFLPAWKGVDVRLTTVTKNENQGRLKIEELEKKITERVGKYIYGYDDDGLADVVGGMLRERHMTIAAAESCTGGLLGKTITDIPGSSDYFAGGVIAYSNELKMKLLSVPQIILEKYGAVSEECARYMAEGAVQNLGANIGVSVTGIAGPSGGTDDKPVGRVYVGLSAAGETQVKEFRFGDDSIRQ